MASGAPFVPEVYYDGTFHPICGIDFGDSIGGAEAVCHALGLPNHHSALEITNTVFAFDAMPVGSCGAGELLNSCTGGGNAYGSFNSACAAGAPVGVQIVCAPDVTVFDLGSISSAQTGTNTYIGSTSETKDHLVLPCGGFGAKDHGFSYMLQAGERITFKPKESTFLLVFSLSHGGKYPGDTLVGCVDEEIYRIQGRTQDESDTSYTNIGNTSVPVFLTIDGHNPSEAGNFTLGWKIEEGMGLERAGESCEAQCGNVTGPCPFWCGYSGWCGVESTPELDLEPSSIPDMQNFTCHLPDVVRTNDGAGVIANVPFVPEIFFEGEYHPVCVLNFNDHGATEVCAKLGYPHFGRNYVVDLHPVFLSLRCPDLVF